MKRFSVSFLIIAVLSFLAFSCHKPEPLQEPATPTETDPGTDPGTEDPGTQPESPRPGDYCLTVIETTDMHGHMIETESDGTVHYRLAYIADKADDIRGHGQDCKRDRLLLLDGGDLYQGASVSNLLSGWPLFVAVDRMGYDAVALGNHEFDWGIENTVDSDATMPDYDWKGQRYENKVPVACANLYQNGSRVPFTKDYVIVEKNAVSSDGDTVTVKIGIIGFADNYATSIMNSQFIGRGFTIDEDYSIANSIAEQLEGTQGCDATILLTHCQAQYSASDLGPDTKIDLVLGGHSHGTLSGGTDWGLAYLQGGRYCERYARADLWFTVYEDGSMSFNHVGNQFTPAVDSYRDIHEYEGQNASEISEDILEVSDAAIEATAEQQKDVIGYINVGATGTYLDRSGQRASTMSNWMCDIIRRIGEADVAFVNSGGIRTSFPLDGQSRRDITVANVYDMFPFSNEVYVYRLTYAELLDVFLYSLTSGGTALFSRVTGIDCYFSSRTVVKLVKDGTTIFYDGSWVDDWASRYVTLAASSYVATTERTDNNTGIPNPLIEWNDTSRLISNDLIDNENAIRVLRDEAAASGGLLHIDTEPHYLAW